MSNTSLTTVLKGAVFSDGTKLSGTWTSVYDSTGTLISVSAVKFTVAGPGGTTTFTAATIDPAGNQAEDTSYQLDLSGASGSSSYTKLHVDWTSERPLSLFEGTPSLYTSLVNMQVGTTPMRLVNAGRVSTGPVLPTITGLPKTESTPLDTPMEMFGSVKVADAGGNATSATIILSRNNVTTDADGRLSGAGLTKTGAGTYSLAYSSAADLTKELQDLIFVPASGTASKTLVTLSVNNAFGTMSATSTLTVACFLAGTMILTPDGEIAVERLRAGDLVIAVEHGRRVARPLTWVGGRTVEASDRVADEARPIRIRAGAFATGVPHRDLLLTPEHCVLTEAGLTPIRMLVNGGSIVVEDSMPAYSFYHLELERHGILVSENLLTESYLDTGNRGLFVGGAGRIEAHPGVCLAAPLAVSRESVEPIWERLAERARMLGLGTQNTGLTVTQDPELRLLLDGGEELQARWHDGQRHMFQIPRGARPVALLSRAAVPAETVGPFIDDRRRLGVAVDRLVLWSGLVDTVLPAAGIDLAGWHDVEGEARWTDGQARLDLPEAGADTFLDVHVVATALYPAARARSAAPKLQDLEPRPCPRLRTPEPVLRTIS